MNTMDYNWSTCIDCEKRKYCQQACEGFHIGLVNRCALRKKTFVNV